MSHVNSQHSLYPAHTPTSQMAAVPGEETKKQIRKFSVVQSGNAISISTKLHTGFKISIRPVMPTRTLFPDPSLSFSDGGFLIFTRPESFQTPCLSKMQTSSSLPVSFTSHQSSLGAWGLEKGGKDYKIKSYRERAL